MNKKYFSPLLSLDVHLSNLRNLTAEFKLDNDISDLINIINPSYWSTDMTMDIFKKNYDALVITNKYQKIIWVSSGFNDMTGYSRSYTKGKTPAFLQGENTSPSVKKQIRSDLKNNHSFSGSLVNYKKNGQAYNCQIKIIPIYSSKKSLKYFLAFEKEIAMI